MKKKTKDETKKKYVYNDLPCTYIKSLALLPHQQPACAFPLICVSSSLIRLHHITMYWILRG